MSHPKFHTAPEHDPIPSQKPTEPQREVPDHDPPTFPERDDEVLFDEDAVGK